MELVTQAVPAINTSEIDLRTNFGCMRALWKGDSSYMSSNGRLTFVTVGHVDDLFYTNDTRCKTIKALLEAIVR